MRLFCRFMNRRGGDGSESKILGRIYTRSTKEGVSLDLSGK